MRSGFRFGKFRIDINNDFKAVDYASGQGAEWF
jgi:hypothetical protein